MRHASRLRGRVQAYDWGSRSAIGRLQGRPVPTAEPEAELWLGGHPRAAAEVEVGPGTWRPLTEVVREAPEEILGPELAAAWGASFPFLLKVLAAERPLSVQAHPDRERARAGHRRETAAGIPLDDPERTYADPHPKPELILALSTFRMLRGVRPARELADLGRTLRLAPAWGERIAGPARDGARELVRSWLALPPAGLTEIVETLPPGDGADDPVYWVARLAAMHPGDPAALAPLVLGFEILAPGEAAFTPAGMLHAYLEGVGIELMVSSDNVVRGGLTRKRVDPDELAVIAAATAPRPIEEVATGTGRRLRFPGGELELEEIELATDRPVSRAVAARSGPEILLCLDGAGDLVDGGRRVSFERGDGLLIPAGAGPCRLEGRARLVAGVPGPRLATADDGGDGPPDRSSPRDPLERSRAVSER